MGLIRWLSRLVARRPDTGLLKEAAKFGHTYRFPPPENFAQRKAQFQQAEIASKARRVRQARKLRAEAGPRRTVQPPTTLRAVK